MAEDTTFTLAQAMAAQRALRDELGLGEEAFPLPAFIGMISDEIQQLREAGRSDSEVLKIIQRATGVALSEADLERFYAPPERRAR